MSAAPREPAADWVGIEVDGVALRVPRGSMIIEATDRLGVPVPRFCYHPRLSIAANCRMCLVDVEKAPKPLPACATPVMDGMKIYTRSKRALDAQRGVMEFLLINHPLDCPICDQGGECELQDLAMGYGRSISRFAERKRVVADEDLGPLVATDMTRCIHCTRCVRFLDEIAGTRELGGMNRGDRLEIGTLIGRPLESELSGNVIDLCPVGALTNKPFRYRARAWELLAHEVVACHDALGSNLYLHCRHGEALRAVPRENPAINECWLSDRDRYSIGGLRHPERLLRPMIRRDGRLVEIDWSDAIEAAAAGLRALIERDGPQALGLLAAPIATSEEIYLLQKFMRGLGCANLDHRLRQQDFADDDARGPYPRFALPLARIEQAQAVLLIGCNPRLEAPILGHRLRKAWRAGARISAINPIDFDLHFELVQRRIVPPPQMVDQLLELAAAAAEHCKPPQALAELLAGVRPADPARALLAELRSGPAVVLLGLHAARHGQASWLRTLARWLAEACGAAFNELPDGGNAVDAWRLGLLPHRLPGGRAAEPAGLNAQAMLASPRAGYLLWQCEPEYDFGDPQRALAALSSARFVIAFSAHAGEGLREHADLLLPVGLPLETDGHLRNADGVLQRQQAGAAIPGDGRMGWRVLRALAERLGLEGWSWFELAEVSAEIAAIADVAEATWPLGLPPRPAAAALLRVATSSPYSGDLLQRRAAALQATPIVHPPRVVLHPQQAAALGLADETIVEVLAADRACRLLVTLSTQVPRGAAWIEDGLGLALPPDGAALELRALG